VNTLLPTMLEVAVPLWQHQIAETCGSAEVALGQLKAEQESLQALLGKEAVLFQSKKKGETAEAFNALAKALAYLSLAPGGVTAFGQKWTFPQHLFDDK
jgi:hypothetical protein